MNERQRILYQINELEKYRCAGCRPSNDAATKCNCGTAREIRRLGNELLSISRSRISIKEKVLLDSFKRYPNREDYLKMRELGLLNKDIAKAANLTLHQLDKYRRAFGLLADASKPIKCVGDLPKSVIDMATSNGISIDLLHSRIFKSGWEIDKAATEKPRPKKDVRSDIDEFRKYLQIAKSNGIGRATFVSRVDRFNWSFEEAATTPAKERVKV